MELPVQLLKNLDGVPGYDEAAFVSVHQEREQISSIRLNPLKPTSSPLPYELIPIPWCETGFYLSSRPAYIFDPLIHGGAYYVQEASSMFLEQALKQHTDLSKPLRVLDLCAAPGGKSTLIQSLISAESLLVTNEIIRTRVSILEENMVKWGASNTVVVSNDPEEIGRSLKEYFDIIVVDAPCSGSGLFRREPELIREWSDANVELCSKRQRRILADIFPALKQNGLLIYSTCSYSAEEDEEIADWLREEYDVTSLTLTHHPAWNIVESHSEKHGIAGYRFFPYNTKGEGFYLSCFRKNGGEETNYKAPKKSRLQSLSKNELPVVEPWVKKEGLDFWKQNELVSAIPENFSTDLQLLAASIYIKNAGVLLGKITPKELIPDHALALSRIVSEEIVGISLKKEEALQYLKKEEVKVQNSGKGWSLVQYEGLNLGWVKLLQNRINNYYPKEWRILKALNI